MRIIDVVSWFFINSVPRVVCSFLAFMLILIAAAVHDDENKNNRVETVPIEQIDLSECVRDSEDTRNIKFTCKKENVDKALNE